MAGGNDRNRNNKAGAMRRPCCRDEGGLLNAQQLHVEDEDCTQWDLAGGRH